MATKHYLMFYHWLTLPRKPADLISRFSSLPLVHTTSATLASLLFLKHTRDATGLMPLQLWFPLPRMPFLDMTHSLTYLKYLCKWPLISEITLIKIARPYPFFLSLTLIIINTLSILLVYLLIIHLLILQYKLHDIKRLCLFCSLL